MTTFRSVFKETGLTIWLVCVVGCVKSDVILFFWRMKRWVFAGAEGFSRSKSLPMKLIPDRTQNLSAQPLTRLSQKSGWIIPPPFLESWSAKLAHWATNKRAVAEGFLSEATLNHHCAAVKITGPVVEANTECSELPAKSWATQRHHFVARYRGVGNLWAMMAFLLFRCAHWMKPSPSIVQIAPDLFVRDITVPMQCLPPPQWKASGPSLLSSW